MGVFMLKEIEIYEIVSDEWKTINGAHVEINDKGEITKGAGGKLNGQKFTEIRKDFTGAKTPTTKKQSASERIDEINKRLTSGEKIKLIERGKLLSERNDLKKSIEGENPEPKQLSRQERENVASAKEQEQNIKFHDRLYGKSTIEDMEKAVERLKKRANKLSEASMGEVNGAGRRSTAKATSGFGASNLYRDANNLEKYIKHRKSIAQDESMNRYKDNNGHLIVNRTVITKASVNPYRGAEIPNNKALGLDPDRIYNLLRCPIELQNALDTFGGLQLLLQHTPVDASKPEKEITVGSIGTEFEFDEETGNVYGSLRVYDQEAIDYIESGKMEQLSAGYAYTADMTSGVHNGVSYDGIMRNIHGNHVAIVERGRIGSDAIVADEMPNEIEDYLMAKKIALQKGALAKLQAQLGMDSAEDLKKTILAVHGVLALDSDKEDEKAEDEIEIVEKEDTAEDEDKEAEDEDDEKKAEDEDMEPRGAHDAALIAQDARSQVMGIFTAAAKVEPLVGAIALDGFNSASEVYAYALKQKGVQTKGINEAGLAALVSMHVSGAQAPKVAMDSQIAQPSKELASKLNRFKK